MIITIKIDSNHPIFNNPAYQKDIVPFNLIEALKQAPLLMTSDEKNYILCTSSPDYPTWIWTDDNISADTLDELINHYYNDFMGGYDDKSGKTFAKFVAKPATARAITDYFVNKNNAITHVVNIESFVCNTPLPPKNDTAIVISPTSDDFDDIVQCMHGFSLDCFGTEINKATCIDQSNHFISNERSFVVKDNGKVIALASASRESDKYIAVNKVYTAPEYRGQGLAGAIVSNICKTIFASGKIPLLYTDLSNPWSNKAYKNIGFVECGKVDEVTLTWNLK